MNRLQTTAAALLVMTLVVPGCARNRNLPTIRSVCGLTRTICLASRSATHTEPKPTATPTGADVPLIAPAGMFVRPLMRITELAQWPPAAQTVRSPAARNAHGCRER